MSNIDSICIKFMFINVLAWSPNINIFCKNFATKDKKSISSYLFSIIFLFKVSVFKFEGLK